MGISDLCRAAALVSLCWTAGSGAAETFAVNLGKTALGTLTYEADGARASLSSTLGNTPLGVFNGTFLGISRIATAQDGTRVQEFIGTSKSSRKTREVTVQIGDGMAVATSVVPASEETSLSDVAGVPKGVMNPVEAVGQLLSASKGCPAPVTIYDGRRAIALTPTASALEETTLTCDIAYEVIAGPGHLSPLKISKAKMQVVYARSGNTQSVAQIRLGSGVFKLNLTRTD